MEEEEGGKRRNERGIGGGTARFGRGGVSGWTQKEEVKFALRCLSREEGKEGGAQGGRGEGRNKRGRLWEEKKAGGRGRRERKRGGVEGWISGGGREMLLAGCYHFLGGGGAGGGGGKQIAGLGWSTC